MKNSLLNLAQQFWEDHSFLSDADEAHGRCLWTCLVFACIAMRHGHNVHLVHWTVSNDQYLDHWSIKLSYDEVIDFTHSQIDEKSGFLFSLADYPTNYNTPRTYPASIFLNGDYDTERFSKENGKFNKSFTKFVELARNRYDIEKRPTCWGWKEWGILMCSALILCHYLLASIS